MSLFNDFTGRRVLVTGGIRGMGLAIVKLMQERGAQVVTTARTPSDDLPPGVGFIRADISTSQGAETVAGAILRSLAAWTSSSTVSAVRPPRAVAHWH